MSESDRTYKRGAFSVDKDTKEYLDGFKSDLRELKEDIQKSISSLESHIKDLIETTVKPIERQVDRHSNDIADLYSKDREIRDRLGKVEQLCGTTEKIEKVNIDQDARITAMEKALSNITGVDQGKGVIESKHYNSSVLKWTVIAVIMSVIISIVSGVYTISEDAKQPIARERKISIEETEGGTK